MRSVDRVECNPGQIVARERLLHTALSGGSKAARRFCSVSRAGFAGLLQASSSLISYGSACLECALRSNECISFVYDKKINNSDCWVLFVARIMCSFGAVEGEVLRFRLMLGGLLSGVVVSGLKEYKSEVELWKGEGALTAKIMATVV